MHISVVRIFAALLAFVLLLFILILSLVAYTPVLEFLPGYEANRSREMLLQNIMRLDSIERQMTQMRTYSDNIALIMEGKTPVVRNVGGLDSIKADKTLVMPSREDSLLRIQMEGEGPYGLGKSPSRKTLREAMAMTAPAHASFDDSIGSYAFAGHDSVLWELVRSCPDKLREVAETLRSNMSLEYVLQVFNEEQMGNWCERIYNKDSEYKYILPLTEGVTTSSGTSYYNYLYACQRCWFHLSEGMD